MPRFCANLSTLFTELPLLQRFEAAAKAGFRAVELQYPYEFTPGELRAALTAAGLELILMNAPAGERTAGERGLAGLPGRQEDFRRAIGRALDYAVTLDCRLVHVLAGVVPEGRARNEAEALYRANLDWAGARAADAGVRLVLEPINQRDVPGYLLTGVDMAARLVAELGPARFSVLFDVYHCQMQEGNVAERLRAHFGQVAHVQIADVPGRNEPGTGELNWDFLFAHLDGLGYAGWVGCEYQPLTTTQAGLWRLPLERG